MTDLFFCNLCDQSVPLARLESGEAIRHGGRVICPTCCDTLTMASKHESGEKKSGVGLALLLALVACVVCVFLYLQMEDMRKETTHQINDSVFSLSQSLSASLKYADSGREEIVQKLDSLQTSLKADMQRQEGALSELQVNLFNQEKELEHYAGLADGQSSLQQSLRSLQTQVQLQDEALREVRTAQEFLRDQMAEVERKMVVVNTPKEQHAFSSDVQKLVDKLQADDPLLRVSAIEKLSKFEDPALIPFVQELLQDSYEMNRFYAANTLGAWKAYDAIPDLIATLSDEYAFVRKEANAALLSITQVDMGYDAKDSEKERQKAVEKWLAWWQKQSEQ